MSNLLEFHVTAPSGTSPEIVADAVREAVVEYANTWGDHVSISYNVEARTVVPVDDPNDSPETPVAHVWIVIIPND